MFLVESPLNTPLHAHMALDLALLHQSLPRPALRTYSLPRSLSFGYTQRIADLPSNQNLLCRRPTAGGVVYHGNDITYALTIPASHPLSSHSPSQLYNTLHQALQSSLKALAIDSALHTPKSSKIPLACFDQPVQFDLVDPVSGAKIAGAAMKRSRNGLLIQGTIEKNTPKLSWDSLQKPFFQELMSFLECKKSSEISHTELEAFPGLEAQFADPAWNNRR